MRLILALIFFVSVCANAQQVVATIKPLHSLVQNILGDTAEAVLLVDSNASVHDYQLKPSDLKVLQQADLIFYIDDTLESFIRRVAKSENRDVEYIELTHQDGIKLMNNRGLATISKHHGDTHTTHDHHAVDTHIWLSPDNAKAMANIVADKLSLLNPGNRAHYQANLKHTLARLDQLKTALDQQLNPLSQVPFIVQHDAYYYFEDNFNLKAVAALGQASGIPSSVKLASDIRKIIKEQGVKCIFHEPQFSDRLAKSIANDTGIEIGLLDPIGIGLRQGPDLYFSLLTQLADNFKKCLLHSP